MIFVQPLCDNFWDDIMFLFNRKKNTICNQKKKSTQCEYQIENYLKSCPKAVVQISFIFLKFISKFFHF